MIQSSFPLGACGAASASTGSYLFAPLALLVCLTAISMLGEAISVIFSNVEACIG